MTEVKEKMQFRREGEPLAEAPEPETPEPETPEPEEPEKPEKPLPFNEDPKVQEYIQRQVETRVADITKGLEEKFGGDIGKIREEFGAQRKANAEAAKIPSWFGGNQQQWDEYRGWLDGQLKAAEERAVTGTIARAREATTAETKAVEEATAYFQSELTAIQGDKALNPSGKAIDPNKLLKVVLDNDLVDSKGRWNYRAGMRLLNQQAAAPKAPVKEKEKKLAGATMDGAGGSGGEPKPKNFKTPSDFRKKRPW